MLNLRNIFNHKDVHQIKNKYQSEMLDVQKRSREQAQQSKVDLEVLKSSRMYKIAVATGGKRRGL